MIRILIPTRIIVKLDQENRETEIRSSPTRLIEGGKAKFARFPRSQNRAISGKAI